jgi:hypothetical protein
VALECEAIGCRARILRSEIFCARHDRMLQSDVRTILLRQFRPDARRQSLVFHRTLERARAEILYVQTEGHPPPRAQAFMWDDSQPAAVAAKPETE